MYVLYLIYAIEGLLLAGKEVSMVSPMNPTNTATIAIKPARNLLYTLRVQAHLAVRGFTSTHIHVMEADVQIPKFSCFSRLTTENHVSGVYHVSYYKPNFPISVTTFRLPDIPSKVLDWLDTSFLTCQPGNSTKVGAVCFISICRSVIDILEY